MKAPLDPRLEQRLAEALALDPEERSAFVAEICADDLDLRHEFETLIALQGPADSFFEGLAGDIAGSASLELETAARPKVRIGPSSKPGFQVLEGRLAGLCPSSCRQNDVDQVVERIPRVAVAWVPVLGFQESAYLGHPPGVQWFWGCCCTGHSLLRQVT